MTSSRTSLTRNTYLRIAPVVIVVLLVAACVSQDTTPAHRLIHEQGMVRTIVVSPAVASSDQALDQIAMHYLNRLGSPGSRAVMLQVWSDDQSAPRGDVTDMTDAQLNARVAVVTINESSGFHKVERPE